jgi:2-methylisocitrate lyase-like PEP mutase family enzyme
MELFQSREFFVIPGAANAIQARMWEQAGFPAVSLGGGIFAGTMLGVPDLALMSKSELIWAASRFSQVVDIPVIVDIDQGFGGVLQARRTVQECINAGIAGVHMEDQPADRRCGFFANKTVVSIDEAVGKFRAVVDAKRELDENFVIIARTDARTAVNGGLEETIERLKAYEEAGVDVLYFEGPQSEDEVRAARAETTLPLIATLFGWDEHPSLQEQDAMGLAAAFYPEPMQWAGNKAAYDYIQDFKERGIDAYHDLRKSVKDHPVGGLRFMDINGLPELLEIERRFTPEE